VHIHVLGVFKSKLDDVVEGNVTLDHGEQCLNVVFVRLTEGVENGVQGIALELKLLDVAFPGSPPPAILRLIVDTICASFQAIRAGMVLIALRMVRHRSVLAVWREAWRQRLLRETHLPFDVFAILAGGRGSLYA
jgi:hypothetical protein